MRKVQVLIVDDHPRVLASIESILRMEQGIEVVGTASNATQAIAKAAELKPDIVIMDFCMDGSDGIEAGQALKLKDPGIDVIILSAFEQLGYSDRARSAGIAGWVSKDSALDELFKTIRLVVSERTAHRVMT